MQARKLTTGDVGTWSRVGDREILVGDVVDEPTEPEARMTVGFARVGAGDALDISFPYDEVLVVTRGTYTVRTPQGDLTARAGEVIYLPAGSSSRAVAEEDAEMVYVANPPAVYAAHVAAAGG
jgi:ethanolamine utilization protein EutQ (cupin superfamily)